MTKKLIWRLNERPTPTALIELMNNGLLTKDEAKEILFSSENKDERDAKSLKSEIKFLRELVESLSKGSNTRIIEIIKEVEKPYRTYPWYSPYGEWYCSSGSTTEGLNLDCTTGTSNITLNAGSNFTDIKTF